MGPSSPSTVLCCHGQKKPFHYYLYRSKNSKHFSLLFNINFMYLMTCFDIKGTRFAATSADGLDDENYYHFGPASS